MRAGKLRNLGQIQAFTATRNTSGDVLKSWAVVCNPWADIRPSSVREMEFARGISATTTLTIEIRFREGITAAMRFVHGQNIYDINGVFDPDGGRRERLFLFCTQSNNG